MGAFPFLLISVIVLLLVCLAVSFDNVESIGQRRSDKDTVSMKRASKKSELSSSDVKDDVNCELTLGEREDGQTEMERSPESCGLSCRSPIPIQTAAEKEANKTDTSEQVGVHIYYAGHIRWC